MNRYTALRYKGARSIPVSVLSGWLLPVVLLCACPVSASAGKGESGGETAIIPLPRVTPFWQLRNRPQPRPGITIGNYFFMQVPALGLGLGYEFKDETRESNGVETTEQYHRFFERLGLRSSGWLYHPAMLKFTATIEPELSHTFEENSEGAVVRDMLFTPDYLLEATLLERKPYTLNLHANRRELPSWAPFKGGFNNRTHDFGGAVDLNIQDMLQTTDFYHANLSYRRLDSSTDAFYDQTQVSDLFRLQSRHESSKSKSRLTAYYEDMVRTVDGLDSPTKTFDTYFRNQYKFRAVNPIDLISTWSYRRQELDSIELWSFDLDEALNVRHRTNLSSFYTVDYSYQDSNSGGGGTSLYGARGRLEHTLFDNLGTSAGLETRYGSYPDASETTVDPFLKFSYTRPLANGDSLSLGSNWNYQLTYRDSLVSGLTDRVVQNEEHFLSFGQDVFLDNYNVVAGSIIVTSPDGTIQYVEGIDYQLEQIGDNISIRSLSLGNIDDGQQVLVHYKYQVDPEYDDGIFSQGYSLGYSFWNGFNMQLFHSRSKQYILDGPDPTVRINDTTNRAVLQHRAGAFNTRIEVAEFDRASYVNYRTWRVSERIQIRPMRVLSMNLSGYYGQRSYDEQQAADIGAVNDSDSYGGMLSVNWRINNNLFFSMEGFSDIFDDEREKTINSGLRTGLVFKYRIWSARLTYSMTHQNYERENGDSSRLSNLIRFDIVRLYW